MNLPRAPTEKTETESNDISQFVKTLGELHCHSFMVVQSQHVVAEGWWHPYNKDYRHMLFSVTKSFTSIAVGFAVQEGLLTVDDLVLKFFPKTLPCEPCTYMKEMKIKDLLMMRTGHTTVQSKWSSPGISSDARQVDADHVYDFLSSYVHNKPGTIFQYNTPATFMCGAILKILTGKHVFDYLKPRLLDPLGIVDYHCEVNKHGFTPAGFGGHMRTEDIAKFGLFLLNRGRWNGKQLLAASWIDEASYNHADTSHHISGLPDYTVGYGYQFWRCAMPDAYRADGLYGQFCIVMPKQDAVVVITSGSDEIGGIFGAVSDMLLPKLEKISPSGRRSARRLAFLKEIQIPVPRGKPIAETNSYSGNVYRLATNILRLTKISINQNDKGTSVSFWRGEDTCTANVGYEKWIETKTGEDLDGYANIFSNIACAGAWDVDTFHLKIVYTAAPYVDTFMMLFDEFGVTIDYTRYPTLDEPRTFHLMGRKM